LEIKVLTAAVHYGYVQIERERQRRKEGGREEEREGRKEGKRKRGRKEGKNKEQKKEEGVRRKKEHTSFIPRTVNNIELIVSIGISVQQEIFTFLNLLNCCRLPYLG
jgi:hypothetical protein